MSDLTFLEEDPEISSQKFAVVSFISPEKILKRKELWQFQQFRKSYVINTRLDCWEKFMAFASQKYNLDINDVMKDFGEFRQMHEATPEVSYSDIEDSWEKFLIKNEKVLNDQFDKENDYQTSMRGLKIRRVGDNLKEIEHRAKQFVQMDNGKFTTAIVEVGKWVPWDPNPHMLENVKSANEELNKLLEAAEENRIQKDQLFQQEKEFQKRKILEENMKKKEEAARLKSLEDSKK